MSGKKDKLQLNSAESDIPPTFYDKIGNEIIMDLTKLTEVVIERYKLLKDIEQFASNKKLELIKNQIPKNISWNDKEFIDNDIASHFILATIMCKNETDMKWFIKQESRLFKARIDNNKKYNMYKILSLLGIGLSQYIPKGEDKLDINNVKFRIINNPQKTKDEKIFYCKFEDALNLVHTHEYFLYKGNIYIP